MNRRKKILTFALLSFFGVIGLNAQDTNIKINASRVLDLDLKTALEIALNSNPTIRVAQMEIQRVDYAKKEAVGNLLPSVSATGQYTNNIMKTVMFMPASMSAALGGASYMEIGYKNSYTGTVSAQMPLVNLSLWEQIKSKQDEIDLILEQARSSNIDMAKQVKDAYYAVLLANSSLKVLEQSIANANEALQTTKSSYEHGVSSEYDYIRAQVQVNNLNPSYISAKNGATLAELQLKMLLSLPSDVDINVTEKLEDYENNVSLYDDFDAHRSIADNSQIRQLDLNISTLYHAKKMNDYQHLPSLAAFGQYVYQTQAEDYNFKDYNWVSSALVGVTLTIPIFNGNTIINKSKQLDLQIKELQLQRDYTAQGTDLQVQSALNSMKAAKEQLIANRDAISQAQRGYEIAKVRYNTGTGTILELNDSELSLTQSRLNYQQSLYDYLSAQANYEKTIGKTGF